MIYQARFYLKIALQNLVLHKARMILALLGILFAVMSLFAFGNISSGMKVMIDREIEKFGKNLLIIRSGTVFVSGRGSRQFGEAQTLKLTDARRIKESLPGIQEVVPFFDVTYMARYREKSLRVNIIGAPQTIFNVRNVNLVAGSRYTGDDERNSEKRIVVGYKVFDNLFEGEDPLGKFLLVHRVPTQVVGVVEERGADFSGHDQDVQVFMPLTTFMRRYSNVDYVKGIYVQGREGVALAELKNKVRQYLRRLHRLSGEQRDDFTIFTMDDILRTREEGIRLVSILTVIASSISFVIGGLGIFAIMLLTVSERRTEIGIRRVVGSRKCDIIAQFLMESAITAIIGGVFGILIGLIVTVIVDYAGGFAFRIEVWNLVVSFTMCILVGIVAGIYPAFQGTKFEPVQALYR
jgi:putative ABC transport system permease protein